LDLETKRGEIGIQRKPPFLEFRDPDATEGFQKIFAVKGLSRDKQTVIWDDFHKESIEEGIG
jgi:hypothetical protein